MGDQYMASEAVPVDLSSHEEIKRMKMAVFWDVAPCSLVDTDQRFRGVTASIIALMMKAANRKLCVLSNMINNPHVK
jgi:hypothetical protein